MYEESESKINWGHIIKKVIIVVAIILVIMGIITLVNRCTKKSDDNTGDNEEVNLTESLNKLEEATLKYFNKDNLPVEINASKTVRLRILQNGDYIDEIEDSKGNACNPNESYVEVTRLENNYAVKLTAVCGSNTDYKIIYIGCFENCDGGVCKGSEDSKGGACTVEKKPTEDKKDNSTSQTNTTTPKKTNTTTKKPAANNSNSSSSSVKPNTPTANTSKPKVTEYEYQKCSVNTTYTEKTETVKQTMSPLMKKEIVYSFKPFRSNSNEKYTKLGYSREDGYEYEKITYCEDTKYTYSSSENMCVYEEERTVSVPVETPGSCETTWSASSNLEGWTKTGKTR